MNDVKMLTDDELAAQREFFGEFGQAMDRERILQLYATIDHYKALAQAREGWKPIDDFPNEPFVGSVSAKDRKIMCMRRGELFLLELPPLPAPPEMIAAAPEAT